MLKLCLACRGAKQVNGLGFMNMVPCRVCKGTGRVKVEHDIDLPVTNVVFNHVDSESSAPIEEVVNTKENAEGANDASKHGKSVSKSIKDVLTHGKKKK